MLIAEIGNNHDGSFNKLLELTYLAKEAGFDYVKYQIFRAEKLVHPSAVSLVPTHKTQLERLKSLEFSEEQWEDIYNYTQEVGIKFLATCFDIETMQAWAPRMDYVKVSSGDLFYPELISCAMLSGKHVLLSTGIGGYHDIANAVRSYNQDNYTLLHCVSTYPCPPRDANLGVIETLKRHYKHVGYSDHVPGIEAAFCAAVMGAKVIEKHFTDHHRDYGDHLHSANPSEAKRLIERIREFGEMKENRKALNDPIFNNTSLRRGAYASREIKQDHIITQDDVVYLRPYYGKSQHIGSKARRTYLAGEKLDA